MPFAAALSQHPIPAHAVGEVVGELIERLGDEPDLAVLFVTGPHTGALEDIASAVRRLLQPRCLVGTTAAGVLAGRHGAEHRPAISLWAGRMASVPQPVRLTAEMTPDGWHIDGIDDGAMAVHRTIVLLADPFTFPVDELLERLADRHQHLAVVGGLASAARGPGGNRLLLDGDITTHGAVGVMLDHDASPGIVVSQGCRPIGQPFVVTRSERAVVYELGGRPALERLMAIIDGLSPDDRALAAKGVHCGVVVDEHKLDYQRGDFLIRSVLGADRTTGAVALSDEVPVGGTIQFQVRDADTAGEDLRHLLTGRPADGALVFTCNGRGAAMFGDSHHDATIVEDLLGSSAAVAGMFCAGEIGPIGHRNALHGFTASVALFRDPD